MESIGQAPRRSDTRDGARVKLPFSPAHRPAAPRPRAPPHRPRARAEPARCPRHPRSMRPHTRVLRRRHFGMPPPSVGPLARARARRASASARAGPCRGGPQAARPRTASICTAAAPNSRCAAVGASRPVVCWADPRRAPHAWRRVSVGHVTAVAPSIRVPSLAHHCARAPRAALVDHRDTDTRRYRGVSGEDARCAGCDRWVCQALALGGGGSSNPLPFDCQCAGVWGARGAAAVLSPTGARDVLRARVAVVVAAVAAVMVVVGGGA